MNKIIKLKRITNPVIAMKMVKNSTHYSDFDYGHYDAGMNFLGELGEYSNTRPSTRGAVVEFEWEGEISKPLKPDCTTHHTPNVLFDFNGSGKHFQNNDPRYFLPYDSDGLVIKKITLEGEYSKKQILCDWCNYKKGKYKILYNIPFTKGILFTFFLKDLKELNDKLSSEVTVISVRKG